ncbi:tyrosine-type recombinase/integrase [Asticcacaulis tiandongensis]|uniref:tyrosine-type recombinase/integrase n=1 Tax=Asticcacaulis tiandongensis TaxID=2565365 RepID=UPI003CCC6BB1
MPLATVLIRYWQGHASKIASKVQAKISLALWNEFFGDDLVSDLSIDRQEAFMVWLKAKGHKNAYVSRTMSVGRAAIRRAWQRGEITSAPFIIDERDRSDEDEPYRLSKAEMRKLLKTAQDWPHLYIFMMISLNTLARPGAVLDLSPFQIDLDSRLIDLNPHGRKRTKKGRPVVPATETILPFVTRRDVSRFVNWHGKPIQSIKKGFATVVKAAGLPKDVTPYSLRHTMAAELRARGVPAWEVEGLLGHKLPGVTEKYAKFAPDYLGHGAKAIDAYFTDLLNSKENFDGFNINRVPLALHTDLSPKDELINFSMISKGKMVDPTGIEPVTPTMST